jgi:hypothetical protein
VRRKRHQDLTSGLSALSESLASITRGGSYRAFGVTEKEVSRRRDLVAALGVKAETVAAGLRRTQGGGGGGGGAGGERDRLLAGCVARLGCLADGSLCMRVAFSVLPYVFSLFAICVGWLCLSCVWLALFVTRVARSALSVGRSALSVGRSALSCGLPEKVTNLQNANPNIPLSPTS